MRARKFISYGPVQMTAIAMLLVFASSSMAEDAPRVGRGAAAKYLTPPPPEKPQQATRAAQDNMLMILVGPYVDSVSYAWKGSDKRTKIGTSSYGITYLFEQWNSVDVNFRADFTEYKIDDENFLKLSLLPLWTFPLMESRFPLYFGLGAGMGVFFKQVQDESNLSLDYQLVAGVRVPDLLGTSGFALEFGLKNHLHLLSDGQFNGTFLNVGAVFTF